MLPGTIGSIAEKGTSSRTDAKVKLWEISIMIETSLENKNRKKLWNL